MVKIYIILITTLFSHSLYANNVSCKYDFDTKYINLDVKNKEFIKELSKEDIHYKIYIKDSRNFNESSDYLIAKNKIGHKVTYSLKCKRDSIND